MKNFITVLILIGIGAYGYQVYMAKVEETRPEAAQPPRAVVAKPVRDLPASPPRYSCDGRQHCSQMTSCAEAKYFIKNCPGTKMDGDYDGVPCERQLCRQ